MAQHKMVIVDGIRYRAEEAPKGAKATEDRERVSTNPLAGQAQVIDTSKTRRGRRSKGADKAPEGTEGADKAPEGTEGADKAPEGDGDGDGDTSADDTGKE